METHVSPLSYPLAPCTPYHTHYTGGERATLITGILRLFAAREIHNIPEFIRENVVRYIDAPPGVFGTSNALCSWAASEAVWVTLVKVGRVETCIYFHEMGVGFVATELAALHPDCPSGTAYIAQIVMDHVDGGCLRPMVMVLDLLCIGDKKTGCLLERTPMERYTLLRENQASAWLCGAGLAIHWAGFRDAAVAFCTDPEKVARVPHKIESVVQYSSERPGVFLRVTASANKGSLV